MDHNKRSQLSRRLVAVMMGALLQAPLVAHAQDQQTAAEIASSGIEIPKVRVQDDEFTVYLDGIWIFTGYDKTLSRGRIAVWAECEREPPIKSCG